MTEEDLKKAILEKVQREKGSILAQARREKDELLKQAKDEATSLREGYLAEIKKRCLLEKSKILNQMNLELKREILEAKEKKISRVSSLVKGNFKAIRKNRERYKSIFELLLRESQEGFDKRIGLKLKVNPSDREIALGLIKELGLNVQLETAESIDSGLELCDSEENIVILNTFESRLDKLFPELRQELSKILFQ